MKEDKAIAAMKKRAEEEKKEIEEEKKEIEEHKKRLKEIIEKAKKADAANKHGGRRTRRNKKN
jgi:cysteine sulfinate desulfinase/cysteine desulfurase-like protein